MKQAVGEDTTEYLFKLNGKYAIAPGVGAYELIEDVGCWLGCLGEIISNLTEGFYPVSTDGLKTASSFRS